MTTPDLEQLPSIQLHSPLAIVGAFLYIVRQRFAEGSGMPWVWRDNKADTDIHVEIQYEPNTEAADLRPGVYIDKDQTSYGQVTLGNRDQNQPSILTRRQEQFISFAQSDLIIDCVSPARGESAQIADAIQQYLHMSARIIGAVFSFRSLSPIVLGRTTPFQRQTDLFNTQLTFRVEYEVRWTTVPAAPVLRALGSHLAANTGGVNQQLTDFYLKSLDKP